MRVLRWFAGLLATVLVAVATHAATRFVDNGMVTTAREWERTAQLGQNTVMQAFVSCELERRECTERCEGE